MSAANPEQAAFWNEEGGRNWVAHQRSLDEQVRPLGEAAMDAAGFEVGSRLLDVGCGCGPTTIELGARVGTDGSVLGVDIAEIMITEAEKAATESGATNVSFRVADVQIEKFDEEFDGVFSRLGVMFFADPTRAFANLRRALRPGGKVAFAAWQTPSKNPWMMKPMMAMGEHVKLPPRPAPGEPGPFSFSDVDLMKGYLTRAGFSAIQVTALETQVTMGGGDIESATSFLMSAGRTGELIADGGPDLAEAVRESMRQVIEPSMDAAAWIVTARG